MKLPLPFLKTKKKLNEYYLALLLTNEKTSAVILQESDGLVKIIGKHEENLTTSLETTSVEELISIIDKTISRAEEILPANIETHKTVFGLKESWVEKETKKIKKEYLAKLKKICDALDMKPIGFMVMSEAIANLLQAEEGAPLSAILIEIDKKTVSLTLFRAGKISESINGELNDSAPIVVDSLLKHFTAAVLPTKIILSHTKESKDFAQQLMKHEWDKKLPFLHVPQITILAPDFDAKAVTYGASQQMGFELSEISERHISSDIEDKNDFGFVAEEDIAEQSSSESFKSDEIETEIVHESESDNLSNINLSEDEEAAEIAEDKEKNMPDEFTTEKKSSFITSLKNLFSLVPILKIPKFPEFLSKTKGIKLPYIIIGIFSIVVLGIILLYYFNTRAEIILSVKPNIVNQDENVIFSPSSSSDFSKNIIASKNISTSIEGDLSANATGKKDIGDKAKGTVTIYSKIQQSKTFAAGTVIKNNDLEFTLDKDVTVASSSGSASSSPATAKADVTAKVLGTESNLPSGAKFSVSGFDLSDVEAKNDSAFSGGNKKTVTVVSKKDLDKLKSDLIKNLENKAIEELSKKVEQDNTIISLIVASKIEKEKFDKKADEEAKSVKLTATINFEGMSYANDELENYEKTVLKDKNSQDISFAEKSFKTEIKDTKVKDKKEIQAKISITAGLLPKIDKEEVVKKIKGKSAKQAKDLLATLPQVAKSEIKFSPNILFFSNLFPSLPNNISIIIKSDE